MPHLETMVLYVGRLLLCIAAVVVVGAASSRFIYSAFGWSNALNQATVLTADEARRVLDAALAQAEQLNVRVAVAVVDNGGHPTTLARMDGATFLATTLAVVKASTAAGTGMSTHDFAELLASNPVLLAGMSSQPSVCVLPGGAPIAIDGATVGGIGVAGAPTAAEEQIARAGVAALVTE
jgi:glc operon protein GlcG